ncbi:hypothetical protein D3C77_421320 [compost metagenome]
MEAEGHRKFLFLWIGVTNTIGKACGGHLTDRYNSIRCKYLLIQLLNVLVYTRAICIMDTSIAWWNRSIIIRKLLVFGDEINDI